MRFRLSSPFTKLRKYDITIPSKPVLGGRNGRR